MDEIPSPVLSRRPLTSRSDSSQSLSPSRTSTSHHTPKSSNSSTTTPQHLRRNAMRDDRERTLTPNSSLLQDLLREKKAAAQVRRGQTFDSSNATTGNRRGRDGDVSNSEDISTSIAVDARAVQTSSPLRPHPDETDDRGTGSTGTTGARGKKGLGVREMEEVSP
jgi:hypothetical protein